MTGHDVRSLSGPVRLTEPDSTGRTHPVSLETGVRLSAVRLLTLKQAAVYLGVSYWSVRDYIAAGLIPKVSMPALRAREGARQKASLRRVLIDREDLDRLIEARKQVTV
jgi:hypothetical protein